MNKIYDEYIDTLNIISKQYVDRVCDGEKKSQIIKEQLSCIEDLQNFKNNLIKYLEDNIKIQKNRYEWYLDDFQKNKNEVVVGILKEIQSMIHIYQDILERVKSGKYE